MKIRKLIFAATITFLLSGLAQAETSQNIYQKKFAQATESLIGVSPTGPARADTTKSIEYLKRIAPEQEAVSKSVEGVLGKNCTDAGGSTDFSPWDGPVNHGGNLAHGIRMLNQTQMFQIGPISSVSVCVTHGGNIVPLMIWIKPGSDGQVCAKVGRMGIKCLPFDSAAAAAVPAQDSLKESQTASVAVYEKIITRRCGDMLHGRMVWFSGADTQKYRGLLTAMKAPSRADVGLCVIGRVSDNHVKVAAAWADGASACFLIDGSDQHGKPTCSPLK